MKGLGFGFGFGFSDYLFLGNLCFIRRFFFLGGLCTFDNYILILLGITEGRT